MVASLDAGLRSGGRGQEFIGSSAMPSATPSARGRTLIDRPRIECAIAQNDVTQTSNASTGNTKLTAALTLHSVAESQSSKTETLGI